VPVHRASRSDPVVASWEKTSGEPGRRQPFDVREFVVVHGPVGDRKDLDTAWHRVLLHDRHAAVAVRVHRACLHDGGVAALSAVESRHRRQGKHVTGDRRAARRSVPDDHEARGVCGRVVGGHLIAIGGDAHRDAVPVEQVALAELDALVAGGPQRSRVGINGGGGAAVVGDRPAGRNGEPVARPGSGGHSVRAWKLVGLGDRVARPARHRRRRQSRSADRAPRDHRKRDQSDGEHPIVPHPALYHFAPWIRSVQLLKAGNCLLSVTIMRTSIPNPNLRASPEKPR